MPLKCSTGAVFGRGTGGEDDRNDGEIVVFIRLNERFEHPFRIRPPVRKLVRAELRHGKQQAVFVRVADAARRHQTEDLARALDGERGAERRHAARDLDIGLRAERLVLGLDQPVAQRDKFSRKIHAALLFTGLPGTRRPP